MESPLPRFGTLTRTPSHSRLVLGLVAVFTVAMGLSLIQGLPTILVAPIVVVTLSFVPGLLFFLAVLDEARFDADLLVLSLGLSLLLVMIFGAAMNIVLPLVGIDAPLSAVPLIGGYVTLVFALGIANLWLLDETTIVLPNELPDIRAVAALALLPLWTIIAVSVLNGTGMNQPIILILIVIAIVPLVAVLHDARRWHGAGVWFIALAVLYHDSLWKYSGFGGSPGVVTAWEAGRWTPGVTDAGPTSIALLENGVLFPAYARLSGIEILTQMNVINPFFVAFIPLAMFVIFRRYVGSTVAVLAASLFVFAHPFYIQYPTAGRAATPVLFFVMFGVASGDQEIPTPIRTLLSLLFAVGIVTTHYGTAYYVLAAFLGGTALLVAYPLIESLLTTFSRLDRPNGKNSNNSGHETHLVHRDGGLSWEFSLFYVVAAISWYMFSVEGAKFRLLPNHTSSVVRQFLSGTLFAGGTTQRVQRTYGGEAISISKSLYIGLAILMSLGILVVYYRKFFKQEECKFNDSFLAVSTVLFGLFGVTVLFQTWGGGRPMMITFSYTAVFAVVGAQWIVSGVTGSALLSELSGRAIGDRLGELDRTKVGHASFALLVATLFLLNSGVASSIALDGRAPNNVPLQPQMRDSDRPEVRSNLYRNTDIRTHVWINEHHPGTSEDWGKVYADTVASGQTDWYRPRIEMETEGHHAYHEGWKPRGDLLESTENGTQPGYVVLIGHNHDMKLITVSNSEYVPLERVESTVAARNRIYTAGNSNIYFARNTSRTGS